MNYELAKQLKDAGFPVIKHEHHGGQVTWDTPTLSELIEACGDNFEALCLSNYPKGNKFWQAYPIDEAYKGDCIKDCCGYETGDTPEEAVAKLWLALRLAK